MATDQLNLFEPFGDAPVSPSSRRPKAHPARRRRSAVAPPPDHDPAIELRPADTLRFLGEVGPDAFAVLVLLAARATDDGERLIVAISTRAVAADLGFLSKDTAHRCLRRLARSGVLTAVAPIGPTRPPSYALHLHGTGIALPGSPD